MAIGYGRLYSSRCNQKSAPCVWFADDAEDWPELETEVLF